jgi:hypothetical protein
MSKPAFTPGPWEPPHFSRHDSGCDCTSIVEGGYAGGIAHVHFSNGISKISDGGNDCPPAEEAKANGFLIAAAPELYAAIDEIVNYSGGADRAIDDPYVMERAHLALAKARGEVLP